MEQKKSVAVNFVLITALSMPAILGFNLLSNIQPLGEGSSIMDLEDFLVSSNLLPLEAPICYVLCKKERLALRISLKRG